MLNPLFEVPELLQAILERLESPGDAGRLACVCHSLFESCVPFAWRRVNSAIQLLNLLPGVKILENNYSRSRYYTILDLPKLLAWTQIETVELRVAFLVLPISATLAKP
ncbi:hypothetical protein FRC12_009328 [Ceratobasidium sp. 428]|nr:hypothetical protein FRC12_009328 [Ceratobasidium sp. 428]